MNTVASQKTNEKLIQSKQIIANSWAKDVSMTSVIINNLFSENEIIDLCNKNVNAFLRMIQHERDIVFEAVELNNVKKVLEEFSRITVSRGLSQVEISTFMYTLKCIVFKMLIEIEYDDNASQVEETIRMSEVLDKMVLFTFSTYSKEREEIIRRQQEDMIELSTPVIQVWEGILAVPLIGTLDSIRTQMIMDKLLDRIVATSSKVAIIDITGIPTVDTLVASHLIKTASATRLIGADIIITGISPVIAQTIVHLGVDLSGIITRAVMADGIKLAMEIAEFRVVMMTK